VLKIPRSFRITLPTGQKARADHAARLAPAWQTASAGHGSKGERDYDLGSAVNWGSGPRSGVNWHVSDLRGAQNREMA